MRKSFLSLFTALAIAAPSAVAAQSWQETNNLQSYFSGTPLYSSSGTTGVVTFQNQTATNTGPTAQRMGMYFGWNWSYNSSGADTPLVWSNANQAFQGGSISHTVTRIGFANQTLHLGSVLNDTWIGVPWAPSSETPIATQASWVVPFFDFGVIAAGGSVNYDIELTYTFSNAADFADWDRGGSLYSGAQGVQLVTPEPTTFALVGFAFLVIGVVRRKKA